MTTLRVVGDVHGYYGNYLDIVQKAPHSLQVGDLGFEYECLKKLDPACHKVLAGNHDNYSRWDTSTFVHMQSGHWLGDHGVWPSPAGAVFFVRGGYSIDRAYRKEGVSWWPDEELSEEAFAACLEAYAQARPRIVCTHECPAGITDQLFPPMKWNGEWLTPSRTSRWLERLRQAHQPALWLFGHHHKERDVTIDSTRFLCLPELGWVDLDEEGSPCSPIRKV